jgi:fluoride ion exporter CrcB/FEX
VDYENNCGDWYENYHTAALTCRNTGVTFGDLASKTPSSSYDYRDPLAWWNCYDRSVYPSSCTVNDVNPIIIDFGTEKSCNTLKIDILTVPSARLDTLKIQYSSNGVDWTDVSGLSRTGQVWKFTETSARYWRVFLSGEGNAAVVITSSSITGSPITLSVPVASSDTASIVADKIKTAIENNANITAVYDVSVSGADVILTAKAPAANVSNLNIAISNGTCAGLTTVSTSTNTTAGVAPVKQQENIYVSGTIGTAGNAAVVVTAAGIANSPITLSVPVSSGDSATTVASKVNAALAQNSDITDFFTISPDNGRYVRLTAKAAADNDPTMNISIANGTCTGLTAIPTSTVDAAGNVGTRQVETATVSGSISYNWTYNLYYQNLPTRDGQSYGSTFFLGKTVPGLKFTAPPAAGAAITANFALEYPFKTSNNLLRFTYSVQLQRG